jgi:hypothetical protein
VGVTGKLFDASKTYVELQHTVATLGNQLSNHETTIGRVKDRASLLGAIVEVVL